MNKKLISMVLMATTAAGTIFGAKRVTAPTVDEVEQTRIQLQRPHQLIAAEAETLRRRASNKVSRACELLAQARSANERGLSDNERQQLAAQMRNTAQEADLLSANRRLGIASADMGQRLHIYAGCLRRNAAGLTGAIAARPTNSASRVLFTNPS